MSLYHGTILSKSTDSRADRIRAMLPPKVTVALEELLPEAEQGLLSLSVAVGLQVLHAIMDDEVTSIAGPKGKHDPMRLAYRHGFEDCTVTLGGRKIRIKKPRVRTTDDNEVELETPSLFKQDDLLESHILERMLHGLSSRDYVHGLEACGQDDLACGISKSSISRRFIAATRQAMAELLQRPLDGLDILVLFIDGVVLSEHTITVALGIDGLGKKHILGLAEGATENSAVCTQLLGNLVERGLKLEAGFLAVIDGSKALRKAVKDFYGSNALIQRCRVHKKRNVLDHLPQRKKDEISKKLTAAWSEEDYRTAKERLEAIALELEKDHPGAAKSLREGLEETLTVTRLGLPDLLARSLRSTNVIESVFDAVGALVKRVKRWRHGEQVQRWIAAGLLKAEPRLKRIKGHRDLCLLRLALQRELGVDNSATGRKTA